MEHLGAQLKKAREEAGLSLREMAARTKISVTALEALERNDFSRLPGGIFGRSFVRSYAVEVGADPEASVSQFLEMLEQSEREAAARRAARRPAITKDDKQFLERQKRALILLRVALIVAAIGLVALVTWRIRVMLAQPVTSEVEAPASQSVIVPPLPADPIVTPAAAALVASAMVVEFDVTGDCWIEISVDGAAPAARLYRAGEHHQVEAEREVLLDVGNAGAVSLAIDGRAARPLGGDGARVRTRITRDNVAEFLQ